jgi:hypothetical protein
MPLLALKYMAEEESSYSDSSSCVFVAETPATKRNDASSHHAEDETSSVDTVELVRSILNPSKEKENITTSLPKNANDVEEGDSSHCSLEDVSGLSKTMLQQSPKGPRDSTGESHVDLDDDSDASSIDTTELVRRIMHPRGTLPSMNTSDRPDHNCEKASSLRAPVPPSTIGNPEVGDLLEGEDDFVLPDQSDSPSSSESSLLEEEGNDIASVCSEHARLFFPAHHHPLPKPSTEVSMATTRHALGNFSPLGHSFRISGRPLDSGYQRFQLSPRIQDQGGTIASVESIVDVDALENSAFGFTAEVLNRRDCSSYDGHEEPIPQRHTVYFDDADTTLKDNISRSDGIVRQGLHCSAKGFSPSFLQSAVKSPYSQSAGMIDESIEKFSDDEEDNEAFGFGQAASTALERWRRYSGDKASRDAVLNGSNGHQQRTTNLLSMNRIEIGARKQSSDRPSQEETRLPETCHYESSQYFHLSIQASGQSFPDTRPETRTTNAVNSTFVSQPLRRPRIRDPSSRPLNLFQPSYPKESLSFPCSKMVSSACTVDDGRKKWNTDVFRAPSQSRNDVFGGSGAGVGSYQVTQQRVHIARSSTVNDRSTDAANIAFDEDTNLPSRKRRNSEVKRHTTNYQKQISSKRKKGYTHGGGKRGRGNWKTTKKRSGKSIDASNRNGPPRASALWAGNSDDPELRHVGGAEMSF